MKKRLLALILTAALAVTVLSGCSNKREQSLTHYTIQAELSADNMLTAAVTVDYVNNYDVPLGELWFNLYANAYREGAAHSPIDQSDIVAAFPAGRSYSVLNIASVKVNGTAVDITVAGEDENVLSVPVSNLEPSDKIRVDIEYTLKLPNVRHRLGYTEKSVNLAGFYPIACVYKNGAFIADPYYSIGDPFYSEAANYDVTLTVPQNYIGAFTGVAQSKSGDNGTTVYSVSAERVRDFAAVLGEYEKASGLCGSTIVNYYYYKDDAPESALNTAISALSTFGDMFGAYPYPEYSVVQTSFLNGGMEYPCLSMISDAYKGVQYNDIIVHETAHQWWYGLVGNDEVREAWLDEGLAEYSTMLFYEKNADRGYTFNGKRADALSAYMLYCETYKDADTSMTRSLGDYRNKIEYAYMTYVKGAIMLDDVRDTVGDTAFFSGLKSYCKNKMYGTATAADLIGALETASGIRLNSVFDSWLNGDVKLYSTT